MDGVDAASVRVPVALLSLVLALGACRTRPWAGRADEGGADLAETADLFNSDGPTSFDLAPDLTFVRRGGVYVFLTEGVHASATSPTTSLIAGFDDPASGAISDGDEGGNRGRCLFRHVVDMSTTASVPDAGRVSIKAPGGVLAVTPDGTGRYASDAVQQALWAGGEPILYGAVGGSVPAFSGSVPAPSHEVLLTPPLVAQPTLSRARDVTLTWQGNSTGVFSFDVWSYLPDGTSSVVDCDFDPALGAATVPSSLLTMLPAGMAYVSVGAINLVEVTVPGWSIDLIAGRSAVDPAGNVLEQLSVQLQ